MSQHQPNCKLEWVAKGTDTKQLIDCDPTIVGELLGKGGGGSVNLVPLGSKCFVCGSKHCVIKKEHARRAILSEHRKIADLLNENELVPKIRAQWSCDGIPYWLMDQAEGKTLLQILEHKHDEKQVEDILTRLLNKIKKLHKLEITHGDLFEGNVMVDKMNNPLLIDLDHAAFNEAPKPRAADLLRMMYIGQKHGWTPQNEATWRDYLRSLLPPGLQKRDPYAKYLQTK